MAAEFYVPSLAPKALTKPFLRHNFCVQWNRAHHNLSALLHSAGDAGGDYFPDVRGHAPLALSPRWLSVNWSR